MTEQTITAVYENGVLHPLEAVVLQEHQKVQLHIITHEGAGQDSEQSVQDEIAAYHALHPELQEKYWGQHVAIHQGELVDHDIDGVALSHRIHARYPNQFVLIRQVESEPERVLHFRSPRFVAKPK